ncbi:sulfotransferase family 2 domain-containing protein [Mesorhizobium sp. ZMM04-4]
MQDFRFSDAKRIGRAYRRQIAAFGQPKFDTWTLLFPQHRIAYVPIPKAANSSIRAELLRLIGEKPEMIGHVQQFDGFDKQQFLNCRHLLTPDWFVFTVVRNPYSRAASAYLDKVVSRELPFNALKSMGIRKSDSFERFLRMIRLWPTAALNDHVMPQARLLSHPLQLPNLRVFRVEALQADWPKIVEGIEKASGVRLQPLERRNRTAAETPWQSLINDRSASLIRRIYAGDFRQFSYPLDVSTASKSKNS